MVAILAPVLLMSISAAPGADSPITLADLQWVVVNDNVMGGRSAGGFTIEDGALRFAGETNTNGGGFSSIRTRPIQVDLSAHDGIQLRVRGDGRRYTWRLTTNARWRGREVAYWADFDTVADRWTTVEIPFSRFVPRFRGSRLPGPQLEPGQITGMGLMIYDGEDGPFELRLAVVSAYSSRAAD
jgi:monofunctional biosynthetic peptidoglycan transglycosylase